MLLILILLMKKKDEKMNFLSTFLMTIILYACYQTVVCFMFQLFGIPIRLAFIAIVNVILSIGVFIKIIGKDKQIQAYTLDKKDGIFLVLLLVITFPILYSQFGMIDSVKYYTTDAYRHFYAAKEFSRSENLLCCTENAVTAANFLPLCYTNEGLMFKVLSPYIGEFNLYRVFLLFDIFIYLFHVAMVYVIVKKMLRKRPVILFLLVFLYALGYPLNSLITGFHYLEVGVTILLAIVLLLEQSTNTQYKESHKIGALFLLNVGILFSYLVFAPLIYLTELIYLFVLKRKQITKKSKNAYFFLAMGLAGIISLIFYFVWAAKENTISAGAADGYIYRNVWSSIILLLPFAFYQLLQSIKNKKFGVYELFFTTIWCYMTLALALYTLQILSSYYFFKLYYVLCPALFCLNAAGIQTFTEKVKKGTSLTNLCVGTYTVLCILYTVFLPLPIKKDYGFEKEGIHSLMGIYQINKTLCHQYSKIYTKQEIKALRYVEQHINLKETPALFIAGTMQERWIEVLLEYTNRGDIDTNNYPMEIQKWNEGNYPYLIIIKNSYINEKYGKYINKQKAEKRYENEEAEIWQMKEETN